MKRIQVHLKVSLPVNAFEQTHTPVKKTALPGENLAC